MERAQWLSGRVLDSRPKGCGFEPHRRHCVVSLSKNINPSLVLVQPRKTRPFITERLLMGRKESKQTTILMYGSRLFLAVPWGCLRFVIVVFPDHTHLLLFMFTSVRMFPFLSTFECISLCSFKEIICLCIYRYI